jgi:predicted ATPase
LGLNLFFLGFPDQARSYCDAALAEARVTAHPPTLAVSLLYGVNRVAFTQESHALEQWSKELFTVTTEKNYPHYRAQGTIYVGWATVVKGDPETGISLMQEGLQAYRATNAVGRSSFYILLLASAHERAARVDEALKALDEPFRMAEETGEGWVKAELYRQRGQLLLRQGDAAAAEQQYRKAIAIAKEQEAKLWELRAATSLAQLIGEQGRRAEARDVLAPIYSWFTEGFDTADLKEAKALLEQLS